jgi:tetratricopeptide (TPR) repeat protein
MRRDQVAFLCGGFAFGLLIGFGLFQAIRSEPVLQVASTGAEAIARPQGPASPTQMNQPAAGATAAAGGAPMVAEINRLKQRLESAPEDLPTVLRLADIYHQAAMWDQSARYYERAVTLNGRDADVLTDLGICYRNLREFDRALEQFAQAHRVNPRHWQSLFNGAVVAAFDLGRFDQAVEAIEQIEAIAPRPENLDAGRLRELREAIERARAAHDPTGGARPS